MLNKDELDYVKDIYTDFDADLRDAMQFLNTDNLSVFPNEIVKAVEKSRELIDFNVDESHKKITSIILEDFKKKEHKIVSENIIRAGFVRGFLG